MAICPSVIFNSPSEKPPAEDGAACAGACLAGGCGWLGGAGCAGAHGGVASRGREIPHTLRVADHLNLGPLQLQAFDLNVLAEQGQQLDADVQLADLCKRHIAVETGVLADVDVIHFHPEGENAQRHRSQLHRTIEPVLQLGLDLPAVLVDVDEVRQRNISATTMTTTATMAMASFRMMLLSSAWD